MGLFTPPPIDVPGEGKLLAKFHTSMGVMTAELFEEAAPLTVANFVYLATGGHTGQPFYDGIIFHRVISGFVIQAGCPEGRGTGGPGYKIDQEFNDRLHEVGVLSMARTNDPNSAGSQFFICMGRVASLDRQYTAFGVTADDESLKNALSIGDIETGPGDRPVNDVAIKSGKVIVNPK